MACYFTTIKRGNKQLSRCAWPDLNGQPLASLSGQGCFPFSRRYPQYEIHGKSTFSHTLFKGCPPLILFLVRLARFERATFGFEAHYSIQLSYRRLSNYSNIVNQVPAKGKEKRHHAFCPLPVSFIEKHIRKENSASTMQRR